MESRSIDLRDGEAKRPSIAGSLFSSTVPASVHQQHGEEEGVTFDPLFGSDGSSHHSHPPSTAKTSSPSASTSSGGLFSRAYHLQPRVGQKKLLGHSCGCCGNRFVFTQDASHSIFVSILILTPVVVFLTSIVPSTEWWSFVIVIALTFAVFLSNFLAISMDPGILPPADPSMANRQSEFVTLPNGTRHECTVCPTCYIPRPPRSSHCAACDYCVEDFDHHCGVLGSCVAKRTYRFFTFFFYSTFLLACYVFGRTVYFLAKLDWGQFSEGPFQRWQIVAAFGEVFYSGCAGLGMFGQSALYTKMACDNTSIKINARGFFLTEENPWDKGCCTNCWARLCGPLGPSLVAEDVEEMPQPEETHTAPRSDNGSLPRSLNSTSLNSRTM